VNRLILGFFVLLATSALAQDVYVPPVPIGIKRDGKVRKPPAPIPFPAEDEPWIRVRSPRFDIISSASEEKTTAIARDLETLASALTKEIPRSARDDTGFARDDTPPAVVFVFKQRRESQPYFGLLIGDPKTTVTGVYVRHEGGGTMFIDGGRAGVERTALHELIHDLLRQKPDTPPPLWIEEGLAEFFGNAKVKKNVVSAGGRIDSHVAMLERNKSAPLEAIFAVRAESAEATAPLFYAQSWAAVDWLMQLDASRFDAFTIRKKRPPSTR